MWRATRALFVNWKPLSNSQHANVLLQPFGLPSEALRQASSLVVAEHKSGKLCSSTLNTVTAASQLGTPITLLLAGKGLEGIAQVAAATVGVDKVLVADADELEHPLAEALASLVCTAQHRHNFSHILAPASSFGKNFLPRAAALLDTQPISDIIKVIDHRTFVRPIYAGNALETVMFEGKGPCVVTARPTAFPCAATSESPSAAITTVPQDDVHEAVQASSCASWLSEDMTVSERPELGAARVVVSGGRALKTAENFKLLEALADALGGAVGATRAAVDSGMVGNELQVGQTGKVVAPDLYIALGISGAIQHLAGMKDSKTIVAINTDPDAPIFQSADYGLVMDIFEALPKLQEEVSKLKS